jgi:dTMP kinase
VVLARLLADDRARHLQETIVPGLDQHDVVISDRFIASSLVIQVLDGVPMDEVWAMNRDFHLPDLNIFLTTGPASLHRRQAARGAPTRFDRDQQTEHEISQYTTAREVMRQHGVSTLELTNDDGVQRLATATAMAAPILDLTRRSSLPRRPRTAGAAASSSPTG